ncbi:MAG TPA: prolyl oligopeptidase family serine peptidase [Gemmatimonadaceae bacterium]
MLLAASAARAQMSKPLPIDVALDQPGFPLHMPIAMSPNGRWVAYTLQHPKRTHAPHAAQGYTSSGVTVAVASCQLWLTDTRSGRTISVSDEGATSWGPSWSPNGKWLAYYSDADGMARLWIRETATGRSHRVSDAIARPIMTLQVPRWTPDSKRIVTRIVPYGSPLPEVAVRPETAEHDTLPTVTVWHVDPARPYGGGQHIDVGAGGIDGWMLADLAVIDVATGTVTTLASRYSPSDYWVASDGRFIAFTSYQPVAMGSGPTNVFALIVVPLDSSPSSRARTIVSGVAIADYGRSVVWSPNGAELLYSLTDSTGYERYFIARPGNWRPQQIAIKGNPAFDPERPSGLGRTLWWNTTGREFFVMGSRRVVAVSAEDGAVRGVVQAPSGYQTLMLAGGRTRATALTSGARSVIAVVLNDSTKRSGFARIDLDRGTWTLLREGDRYFGTRAFIAMDASDDGRVVFGAEEARRPPDLWTVAGDFTVQRRITHTAPALRRYALGATQLVEWKTAGGELRRGTLLLPSNYVPSRRYPLVVYPYPSEQRSDYLNRFGVMGLGTSNMQLLATRGIAVLAPDVPPIRLTDQMRELADVILPGVDRMIALGIADSSRIGVMGHSWGGYTVLALLVQTTRFRAAVMRGGLGDLLAQYGVVEPSGWARGLMLSDSWMGGSVWEQRERFIENSPIYYFDRIRTPLLMIHGEAETTVPIFLADQVFAGLQRLGKDVEYARYAGENHAEHVWRYVDQSDYLARMLRWFEFHLQSHQP